MPGSVDLGPSAEKAIAELIKSGRYKSTGEVLRDGVRLVQEREAKLAVLDTALADGLADADAGRVKDTAELFNALEARYQALADETS